MIKKLLVLILAISGLQLAIGQSKKYLTLEHFTNTRCGVCGGSNPGFYNTIKPFEGNFHHMTIHPSNPYSSCVLYQANIAENTERSKYYNTPGTPTVFFNGTTSRGAGSVTASQISAELAKTSPIEIRVKETGTTTRSVTIEVKVTGLRPSSNYKIYVAAAEKELNYASPNGEKVHYNVFRKFASSASGDVITLPVQGSSINLNYSYTVAGTWNESQMYALVWIQDVTTKEILNSGTKFDPTPTALDETLLPNFKIYPNPVVDNLNLKFDNSISVSSISLTNIFGREIKTINPKTPVSQLAIPVSDFVKGVYFIKINSNGKTITKKWMKQ